MGEHQLLTALPVSLSSVLALFPTPTPPPRTMASFLWALNCLSSKKSSQNGLPWVTVPLPFVLQ